MLSAWITADQWAKLCSLKIKDTRLISNYLSKNYYPLIFLAAVIKGNQCDKNNAVMQSGVWDGVAI